LRVGGGGRRDLVPREPGLRGGCGGRGRIPARFVRIVGVEEADGCERVEPVPSAIDGDYTARVEQTENGAYGVAELSSRAFADALVVELTFMPTLLDDREQALLSVCEEGSSCHSYSTPPLDDCDRPRQDLRRPDADALAAGHRLALVHGRGWA